MGKSGGGSEGRGRDDLPLLQLGHDLLASAVQIVQAGLGAAVRVLQKTQQKISSLPILTKSVLIQLCQHSSAKKTQHSKHVCHKFMDVHRDIHNYNPGKTINTQSNPVDL